MKKLNRALILIFAVVLTVALLEASHAADVIESGRCGDGLSYSIDSDGVLTIYGTGNMWSRDEGGSPWNGSIDYIKSIKIAKGVGSIEANAFSGCNMLKSITFEGSAPVFRNDSFAGVAATAYYPENRFNWTDEMLLNYGGNINWEPYQIACTAHVEEAIPEAAPSCTEQGHYGGIWCSICGEVLVDPEITAPEGHCEEDIPYAAATCTSEGHFGGVRCPVCGDVLVEPTVIPALGHTEEELPAASASCTVPGHTAGVRCSVCGETIIGGGIIPAGHSEEPIPDVSPTCTEVGYSNGVRCAICGEVLAEPELVPALGHSEETVSAVPATCMAQGLTEGIKCAVCGVMLVEQKTVPMKDHVFDDEFDTDCNTPGCTFVRQSAGYTLTVKVTGSNGSPASVKLYMDGELRESAEAADGACSFKNLKPGEYVLIVSKPDNVTAEKTVTVEDSASVDIKLDILGDVTGDGLVTTADLAVLTRAVGRLIDLTDREARVLDVNRDGAISAADLTLLARYVEKTITSFDMR